jgi:hypothetical protein
MQAWADYATGEGAGEGHSVRGQARMIRIAITAAYCVFVNRSMMNSDAITQMAMSIAIKTRS